MGTVTVKHSRGLQMVHQWTAMLCRGAPLAEWLGPGGAAMKAAGITLSDMKHVKTQHYHINCNWKVFCDNYLVRAT